jgi:hypothetical protein
MRHTVWQYAATSGTVCSRHRGQVCVIQSVGRIVHGKFLLYETAAFAHAELCYKLPTALLQHSTHSMRSTHSTHSTQSMQQLVQFF